MLGGEIAGWPHDAPITIIVVKLKDMYKYIYSPFWASIEVDSLSFVGNIKYIYNPWSHQLSWFKYIISNQSIWSGQVIVLTHLIPRSLPHKVIILYFLQTTKRVVDDRWPKGMGYRVMNKKLTSKLILVSIFVNSYQKYKLS